MWGNGITKSHIAQFDVVAFLYMFVGCTQRTQPEEGQEMNIFQQREKIIEDLITACKDLDEEKTNHLLSQLTELDKSAEQKPLPEEPKKQ